MVIPNLFLVSFPTFTIAAFKVMLNRNEYEVAKKKLKKANQQWLFIFRWIKINFAQTISLKVEICFYCFSFDI